MSQSLPYRGRGSITRGKGGRWPKSTRVGKCHRPFSNEVTAIPTLSPAQIEQLIKFLPSSTSHTPTTTHEEEFDQIYAGMATGHSITSSPKPWILDSSASDHMTGTISLLTLTKHNPYHTKTTLPNGHTSLITCSGTVHLSPTITLLNVLYVPIFQHNLLSKLTKEIGCQILFTSDSCFLIPKYNSTPILFSKLHHGLYYFHPSSFISTTITTPSIPNSIPYTSPFSPSTLWHCRLGHVPHAKLSLIPHIPPIPHLDICLTCPLAKFTKLPYPISASRAPDLFHLIHIDIWSRYKTPSKGHHKYFLTIVDDHSYTTWVSLLKLKSDAVNIIKTFVLIVKTQYDKFIKIICSDNALEFADFQCLSFFSEQGSRTDPGAPISFVVTVRKFSRTSPNHLGTLTMPCLLTFLYICLLRFNLLWQPLSQPPILAPCLLTFLYICLPRFNVLWQPLSQPPILAFLLTLCIPRIPSITNMLLLNLSGLLQ